MSKVRVAVIGYGHLGRFHAQKACALSDAQCVAIVEPFAENQKKAREAHPQLKVVADVKEVLGEIDAAVVVTPTSLHYDVVEFLIKNKKHVFCEKPLTATYEQALQIKKLSEANPQLVIQVGHSERCHEAWERREEFKNFFDKAGTARLNRLAPFKGRATDVDVVQDLMIHDIDLMLYLFREMPHKVEASGYKIRTPKYDYACAEFSYKSGRRVIITVGRNHVEEVRHLEVTNEAGCLMVDLFRNEIIVADGKAQGSDDFVKKMTYNKRDHLNLEQEAFYKAILNKTAPMVTVDDGLKAIKLLDLVMLSLEKKTAVVIA